jgi:hypothetical protein
MSAHSEHIIVRMHQVNIDPLTVGGLVGTWAIAHHWRSHVTVIDVQPVRCASVTLRLHVHYVGDAADGKAQYRIARLCAVSLPGRQGLRGFAYVQEDQEQS